MFYTFKSHTRYYLRANEARGCGSTCWYSKVFGTARWTPTNSNELFDKPIYDWSWTFIRACKIVDSMTFRLSREIRRILENVLNGRLENWQTTLTKFVCKKYLRKHIDICYAVDNCINPSSKEKIEVQVFFTILHIIFFSFFLFKRQTFWF